MPTVELIVEELAKKFNCQGNLAIKRISDRHFSINLFSTNINDVTNFNEALKYVIHYYFDASVCFDDNDIRNIEILIF